MPRGEVGWPAFHRGNVPTDTAPVEEEQVGSDVFLLGWHLGQSFFGWQIVVEKQPSDSLWNNGGGIKFWDYGDNGGGRLTVLKQETLWGKVLVEMDATLGWVLPVFFFQIFISFEFWQVFFWKNVFLKTVENNGPEFQDSFLKRSMLHNRVRIFMRSNGPWSKPETM